MIKSGFYNRKWNSSKNMTLSTSEKSSSILTSITSLFSCVLKAIFFVSVLHFYCRIRVKNRIKNSCKIFFVSFCCLVILFLNVPGLMGAAGASRAEFLLVGVGGRPTGMGEAFTAVADDVNTISYNPAGLGQIKDTQISFMHNEWIDDIGYEYLSLAHNLKNIGTVGAEIRYLHMGKIIGRTLNGSKADDFTASNLAATLAYGKEISGNISLGCSVKLIQENIEDESSVGMAFDLGFLYGMKVAQRKLQFGAAVQNFGPAMKFIKEKEPLPLNIKAGVSYNLNESLMLACDGNLPKYGKKYMSLGGEYCFKGIIAARAGYKTQQELGASARLSLGLGVVTKSWSIDYTFVPFEDLGQTHRFSLLVRLGRLKHKKTKESFEKNKPIKKFVNSKIEKMGLIMEKINALEKLNKDIVITLSEKFIYFEDISINIENENYLIFERIVDVLDVMDEYKIKIVNRAENIKNYFLNKGINAERIIYEDFNSPQYTKNIGY